MAESPQPSTVREGASTPPPPAGSAEDRKAAAALSSLDAAEDDSATKKEVDTKALGNALENLSVGDQTKKEEPQKKAVVKIDPADVALLVSELEIPKTKATELLRAHDGDAVKAMIAWVTSFPWKQNLKAP